MRYFLLVDFGTTSTKSTIADLDAGTFTVPESHPALKNISGRAGRCEFALEQVSERFADICRRSYQRQPFDGIVLCSEMHGFAVLDLDDQPLSNYISWKDERSLEEHAGQSAFAQVAGALGKDFKRITGMKMRPGFAPMNFVQLARESALPPAVRIVDLPAWLCRTNGAATGLAHPTMLAGLALYDIKRQEMAREISDTVFALSGSRTHTDRAASAGQIAGYWQRDAGAQVPIYVGIGDHQCSLLGAGLVESDTLSINLGTGAQVSQLSRQQAPAEAETRPYFGAHQLQTITHIPGGRALAEYIGFLQEVGGDREDFWARLAAVELDSIQRSHLDFGLGLFPSARGYDGGGHISHIGEGSLTLDHYLASLLRSFASQYLDLSRLFDPQEQLKRILLSGGIARRLPVLREFVAAATPYSTSGATLLDESLLGLRTVALVAAGRAADVFAAQAIFARSCVQIDA